MKRYKFRLEAVLRVRSAQEEQARAKVALASAERARAAEAAAEAAEAYRTSAAVRVVGSIDDFARARYAAHWKAAGVERSRARVEQAEQVRLARVDDWQHAARAVEVLSRLDERRRAEHAVEVRRDEDHITDDVVSSRYQRGEHP